MHVMGWGQSESCNYHTFSHFHLSQFQPISRNSNYKNIDDISSWDTRNPTRCYGIVYGIQLVLKILYTGIAYGIQRV